MANEKVKTNVVIEKFTKNVKEETKRLTENVRM